MSENGIKYKIELGTSKLDRMVPFYECLLGCTFARRGRWWKARYIGCAGDLELEIYREGVRKLHNIGPRAIRIGVGDVTKVAYALLEWGGRILEYPCDSTLGRKASLRDPEGNLLQLVEASDIWRSRVPFLPKSGLRVAEPEGVPSVNPLRAETCATWTKIVLRKAPN